MMRALRQLVHRGGAPREPADSAAAAAGEPSPNAEPVAVLVASGKPAESSEPVPGGGTGPAAPGDAPAAARATDPWQAAFFAVLVLAIVVAAVWALLGPTLLVVRSVQANQTPLVARSRILAAAAIQLGTPLIRIDPAAVAARIERQIPAIQSASVTRSWPDRVVIVVRDRVPAVAIARGGRFALLDADGVIVRWAAAKPAGMPLLLAPAGPASGMRGSPLVHAAVAVLRQLPPGLRRRLRAVQASAPNQVSLILRHQITIDWGGPGRAAVKARELAALMRTKASYYDVSDPGTALTR